MPPTKGSKQRNFPSLTLEQALVVPQLIQDEAAGRDVTRVTLAALLDRSPGSSEFERIVMASRSFGLTSGGSRSDQFGLTEVGRRATSADEADRDRARREAIFAVDPYRAFLESHNHKRVPAPAAFKDFLVREADVPETRADECMQHILGNARFVGFTHTVKGGAEWIEFNRDDPSEGPVREQLSEVNTEQLPEVDNDALDTESEPLLVRRESTPATNGHNPPLIRNSAKVFIAHGKNRQPLEQLKKMLDQFKVPYAIAVDEPHGGRPISAKVATLMRDECSSGIFIFTADEAFTQTKDGEAIEIWRPSENVVYELGAASILYENRIVIFKEDRVTFPSDFSDLGYITFKSEQLGERMGDLFGELVKLDILEVRAKG